MTLSERTRPVRADLLSVGATALAALAVVWGCDGAAQAAPTYKVLYSFANTGGVSPNGGLIADAAGNLYGTTVYGGTKNDGVVFELSPPAAGKTAWTETVLHSFKGPGGQTPFAGLIADGAGNLYGTTVSGGAHHDGVVFELSPPAPGRTFWTEKVLRAFKGINGRNPIAGLTGDGAGNLFGTTYRGGANNHGVVFELSPPPVGKTFWTERVLQTFNSTDGASPIAGVIADGAGNLYGTTQYGGTFGRGVAFELTPPAAGQTGWTDTVIYSFGRSERFGDYPHGGLIADGAGNLYGTTIIGGAEVDKEAHRGTAYELTPPLAGRTAWTETVLYDFGGPGGIDGLDPDAGLIVDGAGHLYGTTPRGGTHLAKSGVLFELIPPVVGQTAWTQTVLHAFGGGGTGKVPHGGLMADGAGNLYGTTSFGGAHEGGVVFELTP